MILIIVRLIIGRRSKNVDKQCNLITVRHDGLQCYSLPEASRSIIRSSESKWEGLDLEARRVCGHY